MNELKPCPFCGNAPVIEGRSATVDGESDGPLWIECKCEMWPSTAIRETLEAAIAAWNTRTPQADNQ